MFSNFVKLAVNHMEHKEVESKIMCDYEVAYNIGYKEACYDNMNEKRLISIKLNRIKYMLQFNCALLAINMGVFYFIVTNMNNKFLVCLICILVFNISYIYDFRRLCRDIELKT